MSMVKNFLIRLLIALCRPWVRNHPNERGKERFLIVSTTGLGDTLWATPAIRALRTAYPKAYIALLTSTMGREILQHSPHIDEIFVIKELKTLALFKRKIATIFVFHTSQRATLPFCALLGATQIIGTEKINKGLDFLLTDPIPCQKIHEIERRMQIVEKAGCTAGSRLMEFFVSKTDHQKAATLIPAGSVIGLHPGAKDRFKQWAPAHFIALGRKLAKRLGCSIVVTGTPAEKQLVSSIAAAIEGATPIYTGVSIPTLSALIERFSLYITNDTGPLHIACATKTPTIALFTPTDPLLCGPYHAPHVTIVQKAPTCFPCMKKRCQDPFCMLQINPDEVFETAMELLSK